MNQNSKLQLLLSILSDACADPRVKFDPKLDLLETDLLDSLALIELLEGIEDQFGIALEPTQIPREGWRTAESILTLIEIPDKPPA